MMATKQDSYQARKLAAGLCRRCGWKAQRPRLVRANGKASPYCEPCGIKASAEALERYHRRRRQAGATLAPAAAPVEVVTGDPNDPEMVRRLHLAQRRCAGCQQPLPAERIVAEVEMCYACQPAMEGC